MSSTSVSTFVTNTIPVVTERCGEVYCSLDLDNFLINCLRCSQEFNLLSCNLFIKHIKECLSVVLQDLAEHNPLNTKKHELANDYSAKEDFKETEYENHQVDPLISIKQEYVKEKEEVNDVTDENTCEDVEYLSDYQNEDDLPLEKLARRKIVEGIISEFKKHPVLWDSKLKLNANREIKKHEYKRIRKAVNSKYKTSFSDAELRAQISKLRCCYRRVLRRKIGFEKIFAGGTKQFKTKLWYFDKLAFIEGTVQDNEIDLTQNSETEQEAHENESDENESDSSSDLPIRELRKKQERPNCKILTEPKIISDIIRQYKQYPFLWDQTTPLYNDKYARKDAYRKITNVINQKFHKKVSDKEIKQQIINLRSGYRRAQRKKHKANYRINLWYYDELSFIDNKAEFPENIADEVNPSENSEEVSSSNNHSMGSAENNETLLLPQSNNECDDDENFNQNDPNDSTDIFNDEQSNPSSSRENNKRIILSLIEEYKKHPCLWDNYKYKTSCRFNRYDALKEIMSAINAKYNTNFTETEIRNKIVQLRSSYRRVLRNKEGFEKKHANAKRKFFPQLWYFDKMTFIGAKESDFSVSRKKKKKSDGAEEKHPEVSLEIKTISDEEMYCTSAPEGNCTESRIHEENSSPEPQEESLETTITENKPLLRAIIEEYKKKPHLWEGKPDKTAWKQGLDEICAIINQKFNTTYNYRDLGREIKALTSIYKRMLLPKERRSGDVLKSKAWYSDLLSFVDRSAKSEPNESCQNQKNNYFDGPGEEGALVIENNSSGNEEVCQRENKVNTKEIVFKIIELYKCARILWDINHPQYVLRTERKKCVEKIIAKLSEEYNCHLTVEEFRYQIRFFKQSYFRAVRQEITAKQGNLSSKYVYKPFFFEEMSFLEPFADKNSMTVPDLQNDEDEQIEDFTFLCEKKSLMIDFIELYKDNACLWDQNHSNRNDSSAHAVAYNKLINLFKQNGEEFTEKRVRSAISFLHSTLMNTHDKNNTKECPAWFLQHLQFLGKIPRVKDKYCSHCNQHFRSFVEYEKHKIEIAGDYPYKCDVCNAGFVSRSKYAYHQITHKEPHKCEQCGFQAFDKHNFNVHMRRHKGIHLFRCDECDKGFVTSTELNRHLRIHTGEKPYVCEICGKSLVANSEFYHHMKRHRNQRDHKCEVCDSAFFTAKTLKDHMASHSSERQHVCEVCGSAFKRKKTLHQHKALHLEKKKHECNICGKLFAQKAGVYSHMKSHGQVLGS